MQLVRAIDYRRGSVKLHIFHRPTPQVFLSRIRHSQDITIRVGFGMQVWPDTDLSCHVPMSSFCCTV